MSITTINIKKFKLLIIITPLYFIVFTSVAQNEANNWYFGNHAGITFNTGVPAALTDGALNTYEGCATISSVTGQLLFYTNGITVWDNQHNPMPNGTDLLGDFSSTQSGIIVPHPGNSDLFYVFSVDNWAEADGLRYSVVDISLNGGFGDVTAEKNILLHTPSTEKITAVRHANGNDIWVVAHKFNSNEFTSYLISNTGLDTNPVISSLGFTPTDIFDSIGYLKLSPDGSKLAIVHGQSEILEIFEFNNSTGIISNPIQIGGFTSGDISSRLYGLEFSPNNQFLYVSETIDGIYQFDLSNFNQTDIIASKTQIIPDDLPAIDEPHQALQLGPDGKIYVAHYDYGYLGIIHNPDLQGNASNYEFDGVYLDGKISLLGLPPFIQSYFSAYIVTDNNCYGDVTQFSINSNQTIDSILWDFGDGNTSTLENPIHTYSTSGTFTVSVTVASGADTTTNTSNVTIYDKPSITSPVNLIQCDDNMDGFSVFNLTEANAELTSNYQNETITFYETQTDADSGNNPITNNIIYTNQTASTVTIWARIENTNGCHSTAQVNLIVSTTQIPNTYTRDFYQCDDGIETTDGIATFDFSSVNAEIEAMFPTGQQLTINYYQNQTDALSETNPIADISNYQNIGYPNSQDIFIRVDSALDNDCLGLGHHITLHVETVPVANPVTISEQCDDDGDGMFSFDTSNVESQLLNGQTNASVEYFDDLGNPLSSPLPNPFLTASQTITARVTNTSSQDPDGACSDETQIIFTVDAAAVAYTVPDFIECDDDNDGQFAFDTSNIEASVLNGQTGMIVTYTDEDGNTLTSPLPNPFTTDTQTITVRVENQLSAVCYDETNINFIVNEQPTANPIANDFVCDDISNDGEHTFTLSDYDSQILNGQSQATFEVFYFENNNDAQNNANALPNNYVVSSTSQTIFARIQNINNTNCFEITSFELGVLYLPIANEPGNIMICDNETNDGLETFDLSVQDSVILDGQSAMDNVITYHLSLTDAENNTNAISESYTNTENPQTIFVRLENNNNSDCYTTTSFQVIVNEQPVLDMRDQWPICEGDTVEITADAGYDEYLWSTGETSQSIIVDAAGIYEITATNLYGSLSCNTSKTITVANSNIATINDIETIDWTQNNNAITVFVEGYGDYEYSLDGIVYQDSNEFTNLTIDEYTIYVRDKNGCGVVSDLVYLLYYPKFFTPNGDGYNDTWQLVNSEREPNNKIYIFDRYGKLLKQLSPMDAGWDGTFNGNQLPSNDYWFLLERQNGKSYRGHFALKR
ncbi:MAG: T9SS type B sorting domain-containing protein [Xanthomarina gelatinilytica]|uniref:T9SS type B sorting domain-containing protein n=1 Tax=Xanthomarina gelatinilytica TaxID=1137281 RepID=UPI003A86A7CF